MAHNPTLDPTHPALKPLLTALFLLFCSNCGPLHPPGRSGSVDHIVLVWLKRPGNEADRAALIEASSPLRAIPGLIMLDPGTALPSSRPIVDDSFDVAFVMRFDSAKALQAYDTHPAHLAARDTLKALSRKILIYDIVR